MLKKTHKYNSPDIPEHPLEPTSNFLLISFALGEEVWDPNRDTTEMVHPSKLLIKYEIKRQVQARNQARQNPTLIRGSKIETK